MRRPGQVREKWIAGGEALGLLLSEEWCVEGSDGVNQAGASQGGPPSYPTGKEWVSQKALGDGLEREPAVGGMESFRVCFDKEFLLM